MYVLQAKKLERENFDVILVEVLDSLMGCDLGNICAKAGQ
jgi:hypothetical protein